MVVVEVMIVYPLHGKPGTGRPLSIVSTLHVLPLNILITVILYNEDINSE